MDKLAISLDMLGETIDFYDDGGYEVNQAFYNADEENLMDAYNEAMEAIKRRYNVVMKFYNKEKN